MTGYQLVLAPAKGALAWLAASLLFALVLLAGLSHYHERERAELSVTQQTLQGLRSEIETFNLDLASIEDNLMNFRHLTRIGLIGSPDREAWVQDLEAIYRALELPPALRYTLAPPAPQAADPAVPAGLALASPARAMQHDLDIELSGLHEGEFQTFIDALGTDWQTPFRLEACAMKHEAPQPGLHIKCTIRLFSLPLASEGQAAGG